MSARHGHITIECDGPECNVKFPSASFLVVEARELAMSAGWFLTGGGRYKNEDFHTKDCEVAYWKKESDGG